MTALNDCPSDEQLKALLVDRLSPEMSQQVIEHIDQCPICQAKLADPIGLGELASQLPNIKIDKRVSPRLKTALESTKLMSVQMYGSGSGEAEGSIELTPEVTAFTQDGYDLLEQIGQGGMGIVFRAREWSLDRIVAVKVLSPLLASDSSSRTRFLREARSAAAVVHPTVITIHAVSEKHALPYIVSEFVEGVSLQQQLDSDAGISLDNIIRIGRQIAAGLSAAHQKGVIHRDIKPANILLNAKTGKVLLGDFGLARSSEQGHLTRTGMLLGTPAYIAPECLEDPKSADQRADLFSLGAVMYAMCTGDSPFAADTLLGTLQRLSSFQPKSLAEQIPGMPEWFSDCVMKLLARYPEDRFQTAAEFRDALGQGNGSGSGRPVELELGRAGRVTGIATRSNKDTPTLNANDVTIPLMPTADQVQTDDQTGTRSSIVINTDPDSTMPGS
ncbi:MAG: serine/threonine-protein kinase [Planctomycetota bacterium]